MRSRSSLILVALVALTVHGAVPRASASCPQLVRPLAEWHQEATAVFVGRALETTQTPVAPKSGDPEDQQFSEHATRFLVEERFKGDLGEYVTVLAGRAWDDCIVKFDAGERYVVFAFRTKWNAILYGDKEPRGELALRTDDSSPTARVSARPEVVAYLRRLAAGRTPSVVGVVYDRTPESIPEMYARTHLGWYGIRSRGGVRVVLERDGEKFAVESGDDGAFIFDNVPPGTYSIRLELPKGVRKLDEHGMVPFGRTQSFEQPDRVEIKADATIERHFMVSGSAQVTGRVVPIAGTTIRAAYVYLVVSAEAAAFTPDEGTDQLRAFLGNDGRFVFEHVPPGEYVLAINPSRDDAFDVMGPAAFHPGVLDLSKAPRLRIRDGHNLDLGDVKAPPRPSFRKVEVRIVDAAGVGHHAGLLLTSDRDDRERYFQTDESGRTTLWLRPGIRFQIEARSLRDDEGAPVTTEIPVEGPLAPIRMVLPSQGPGSR